MNEKGEAISPSLMLIKNIKFWPKMDEKNSFVAVITGRSLYLGTAYVDRLCLCCKHLTKIDLSLKTKNNSKTPLKIYPNEHTTK